MLKTYLGEANSGLACNLLIEFVSFCFSPVQVAAKENKTLSPPTPIHILDSAYMHVERKVAYTHVARQTFQRIPKVKTETRA